MGKEGVLTGWLSENMVHIRAQVSTGMAQVISQMLRRKWVNSITVLGRYCWLQLAVCGGVFIPGHLPQGQGRMEFCSGTVLNYPWPGA